MNRSIWIPLSCFSLFSLFLVSSSSAQEEALKKRFTSLDKNADGFIDLDEAPEGMKKRITKLDSNGDGKLTAEELAKGNQAGANQAGEARKGPKKDAANPTTDRAKADQAAQEAAVKGFKSLVEKFDKNGDGNLQFDEVSEPMQNRIGKFDKNTDKAIDQAEWVANAKASAQASAQDPAEMVKRLKASFAKLDTDGDHKIDLSQVDERGQNRLKRFDTNGDGQIDASEMESALKNLQNRGKGKRDGEGNAAGEGANKDAAPAAGGDSEAKKKQRKNQKKSDNMNERAPQAPKRPADQQGDADPSDRDKVSDADKG